MAFDDGRIFGAAFDDIGIDGSLEQKIDIVELAGFFLKDADKFGANDFSFLLRITDAR